MGSDEGEGGEISASNFSPFSYCGENTCTIVGQHPDPPPDHSAGAAGGGDIESSRIWRKTAPAANLSSTDNVQITGVLL